MESIPVFLVGSALRLVDKGTAARKRVVRVANQLRVGEGLAADLGGQRDGELAEVAKLVADVDLPGFTLLRDGRVGLVEEHAQQRLRAARVLDRLVREEEPLAGVVVEDAVFGLVGAPVGLVRGVLEEEDDAVDRVELRERVGFEREEFLELDTFYAEIGEEIGKDARVGLDWGQAVSSGRY